MVFPNRLETYIDRSSLLGSNENNLTNLKYTAKKNMEPNLVDVFCCGEISPETLDGTLVLKAGLIKQGSVVGFEWF